MNDEARIMRIVVPTEQRSKFGRILPCEYTFDVEPCMLDDALVDWAKHNGMDLAHFEGSDEYLSLPTDESVGWHIMPISFLVERLEPDDVMCSCIDGHLIERVVAAAELLASGPFQR